ncbi:MAG: L-glutamate gamma-semialdehyde dehydrogenase [Vicinamibacteria bacterium]|nr:L-glutamate gamma-semialdehyde dehydrogenase [Vicinamibacteria bacterium]
MSIPGFLNESSTDFSIPQHRDDMERALRTVALQLGRAYRLLIDGKALTADKTFQSINPSRKSQVIGEFPCADVEHVDQAVRAAERAFAAWSRVPAAERARILFESASEMRKRKNEFSAWLVNEVGKTWREADADTNEAIDFLEFYAREGLRYDGTHAVTPVAGERNGIVYIPLGVCAVIPPWNFPLAILVGMTSAAIVSGNTVVLKPSSDAPAIANRFAELMFSIGLPPGVLNLVTGAGSDIGDALVSHPRVRLLSFTGSKAVGLRINELAARPQPAQRWIKRVIAEMGGKDAIIVDRDADIDLAASGVVASAFGYQGQKCSACSRAVVDRAIYAEFVEKLQSLTDALRVGPADDYESDLGPVINERAMSTILDYIEIGRREGRLVSGGGDALPDSGYFIRPALIADVDSDARIAQEEIFGPVLAIMKARDFDQALTLANDTEYGLTGAVYTSDADKIERAKREFHVGNLYINRKCTGALVGAHPFGGFNMSGTCSKAGGRDYLLLYTQAKSIAEKIID